MNQQQQPQPPFFPPPPPPPSEINNEQLIQQKMKEQEDQKLNEILAIVSDAAVNSLAFPMKENQMEDEEEPFFTFLERKTKTMRPDRIMISDIYQTVSGNGILEDIQLRIKIIPPTEDDIQLVAAQNILFHSLGLPTGIPNIVKRTAFLIQSRLLMVNKAVIATLKEAITMIDNPERRIEKEIIQDGFLPTGRVKKTFNTEIYMNFLSAQITDLIKAASSIMGSSTEQGTMNVTESDIQRVSELLGLHYDGLLNDNTAGGLENLDDHLFRDMPDIAVISKWSLRMAEASFQIKTGDGIDWDLEDLENKILQQSFEMGFNERTDVNIYRRDKLKESYRSQMFKVYTLFWKNYFSNVIPIICAGFFSWVPNLPLMNSIRHFPFFDSLVKSGILDTLDEEEQQAILLAQTELLNWKEPDEMETNFEGVDEGEDDMEDEALVSDQQKISQDQINFGRDIVERNIDDRFSTDIMDGFEMGLLTCRNLDNDQYGRGNYLVNVLQRIQTQEVKILNDFTQSKSFNQFYELAQKFFGITNNVMKELLDQGFRDTIAFIAQTINPNEMESTITQLEYELGPFELVMIRSAVNWFGLAGTPNPTYNLFSTFLRPNDPVIFKTLNSLPNNKEELRDILEQKKSEREDDEAYARTLEGNGDEGTVVTAEGEWGVEETDPEEGLIDDDQNERIKLEDQGVKLFPLDRITVPLPDERLYPLFFKSFVLKRRAIDQQNMKKQSPQPMQMEEENQSF